MKDPFRLDGKVAIITGSSRGIGRSIAETMAGLGAKVVISSRKAEPCEEVAAAIKAEGGEAIVIPCNIGRKDEVEALVAKTKAHWGQVDILVCNAAVNPSYGPMSDLTDDAFDKIMGSNVKSNLWLCNLVMPDMAKRGRRRGRDRVLDRGVARLADARRLRHLEGGRFRARPQSGRRMGAEERAHQLHRAGPGEDRFRQGALGE